ncbi:MAG TPA: hypothetical protein VFU51_04350 [Gaiellaceae bacterium]|jgi:hypothetical protein|nr:hypothetical protein [Gaiellaceae bacterium]
MRRVVTVNCLALLLVLIAVAVAAPSIERARKSLPLPFHTRVTLTGQTLGSRPGQHVRGHVFATARWNDGARYVVATPLTDQSGRWRVTFHPSHRGLYTLRILTPDAGLFQYAFTVH